MVSSRCHFRECAIFEGVEYHEVHPIARLEAEQLMASGNEQAIVDTILSLAFYDPDWRWVQARCLELLAHADTNVRWNAAICLGHLARIHGQLDTEVVVPRLSSLKNDLSIGAAVQDALEDIRFFIRTN